MANAGTRQYRREFRQTPEFLRQTYAEVYPEVMESHGYVELHHQHGSVPHAHAVRPDGTLGRPRPVDHLHWLIEIAERDRATTIGRSLLTPTIDRDPRET